MSWSPQTTNVVAGWIVRLLTSLMQKVKRKPRVSERKTVTK